MPKDPIPKLIKLGDDTVQRDHVCRCGKTIYKKNVTTGTISVLSKGKPPHLVYTKMETLNNPSMDRITCPNCDMQHIVGHVKEEMNLNPLIDNPEAVL